MVRAHYTSRPGSAARGGRAFTAAPPMTTSQVKELPREVTGDLVECPVCRGGCSTVRAPFGDPEQDIVYAKTRVIGSHRFGGYASSGRDKCTGSHRKV